MANELVLMIETEQAIPFTVSNTTGIEKGANLTLSDPMTAATVTSSEAAVAGVAKNEKIASDGVTKLAVYRGGIFKATISGAVTVGDALTSEQANKLGRAKVNAEHLWGTALETGTNGETILVELNPRGVNLA